VEERRAEIGGVRTRLLLTSGAGPTTVLLHGFGDSADTWRPLMMELAARGRTCVAVDLPGFGAAAPLRRDLLLPQWDHFVSALVRETARRTRGPVVVAGNSLGGLLTLRTAQHDDLPVIAAVPIAPGGLDRPRWIRLLGDDFLVRRLLALPIPVPRRLIETVVSQAYLRAAFFRPAAIDPIHVATFADHLPNRTAVRRLVAVGRALAREAGAGDLRLHQITCPLLVVWGEEDRLLSPQGAEMLADAVPDATVLRLTGCGHCPQIEQPAAVAAAMDRFLVACCPRARRRRNCRERPVASPPSRAPETETSSMPRSGSSSNVGTTPSASTRSGPPPA